MRKTALVILCLMLIAGLAGCGKESSSCMSYDDYDISKYVQVGQYKGLKVKPYTVSVSDDELNAAIKEKLEASAEEKKLKEGEAIKNGDKTVIDYSGKIDGKKFEGGTAEDQSLEIGSGQFIEGFESGLIGKKVGENVSLDLKFPDDYQSEELKGKPVVFDVTINSATRKTAPSEEKFVKNSKSYDSVAEFEKEMKSSIKTKKEAQAIQDQKGSLWSDVLSASKLKKTPEKELEAYKEFNSKKVDAQASAYQISKEEMLKKMDCDSEEAFAAVNEDSSKLRIKQEMIVEHIAKQENISCSEDEIKTGLDELKAQGYTEDTIYNATGREAKEYVRMDVLYEKVLDFLLENAKITGSAKAY